MKRISLTGRLLLLVTLFFVFVQLVTTFGYLAERREATSAHLWLPFPDQLEAMAVLFDGADGLGRRFLERAFSSGSTLVYVVQEAPETVDGEGMVKMRGLSAQLRAYSDVLGERDIQLAIPEEEIKRFMPRLRGRLTPEIVRISMRLSDGNYLIVQRRDGGALTISGLPVGLLSGMVGAGLALLMVLAVWVQTRPLRRLRGAVERFGETLEPQEMPVRGAPDLQTLTAAINEMQMRITRLHRGRTDMIMAIAHDIRTPLTRLQLRLRGTDAELRTAAARDIAEIVEISEAAERYAGAELAALEHGVDLRALLQKQATRETVSFADAAPDVAAEITGNQDLLERSLDNLISNALRYGTRCSLTLSANEHVTVTVDDDGPGIPADQRQRLLRPFERGEPSRNRASGGSGLGLAIANRVVRRHGGRLELGDAPGGGLRVTLRFPRAVGAQDLIQSID